MGRPEDDRVGGAVRTMMGYVRLIGFVACSLAALGYAAIGNYNMTGLMLALAVLSWLNIRRKRNKSEPPADH
ncbi:hypothetical protein [Stutzerimonas xanthomarina]|uniref:PEP-CTERM protein-sorting domain-containing protein n=2 Tax=Stutzerimonas xanthomarina TaxID=271420 RepID=A0A1M5KTW3_9GAMM|nr:hypothetical protein [Stutzerimonas xanthomarina]MCP9337273.1 hypothetical protein [Stutzerimonas xanthomarina]SEI08045.1 PEP-CTERM protein-sorting domain-containing protein [Stutzerimonas xanthomarina]SHG55593.1 PEP-CTERM protein-sorting domain-containing protein [Stutzerimonas xanthomarina DSM 18231]